MLEAAQEYPYRFTIAREMKALFPAIVCANVFCG